MTSTRFIKELLLKSQKHIFNYEVCEFDQSGKLLTVKSKEKFLLLLTNKKVVISVSIPMTLKNNLIKRVNKI